MAKNKIESQINAFFKALKNFEPPTLAVTSVSQNPQTASSTNDSPLTSVSQTVSSTNDSSASPVSSETLLPLATQSVPINTKSVAEQIKAVFERIKTYKPQPKKEKDSQNSTPLVATNISSPSVASTNISSSPKTTNVIENIKAVFNRIKTYKPKKDGVGQKEDVEEKEEEDVEEKEEEEEKDSSLILEALSVANAVISSSPSSRSRRTLPTIADDKLQQKAFLRSNTAPAILKSQLNSQNLTSSTSQNLQTQNSQTLTGKQQKPETLGVVTTLTNQSDPSKDYTYEYKF